MTIILAAIAVFIVAGLAAVVLVVLVGVVLVCAGVQWEDLT